MRSISFMTLALAGLAFAGCSESGSNYVPVGGATAGVSSGTGGTGVTAVGPLYRKAIDFERTMQAQHLGLGQVQDIKLTGGQITRTGNAPSRQLWTGFYTASQAMRYRATQDADALAAMERSCWALHDLAEVSGIPGVIARGYDEPHIETNGWPASGRFTGYNYNKGGPSRDQYTGWFYGVGQAFPHIQDPALRAALQADVTAVLDKLMANNLEMGANWGPTGQYEEFFNLNPNYFYQNRINAHTWATVDDFPFNLIARSVPYSPQLAQAIQQAQIPPIRAGEALRALFMFTVGYEVTGDPRYLNYKNQLLHQQGFGDSIDKYSTIMDDLLHGQNLQVAEDALRQTLRAVGDILEAYLVATGQSQVLMSIIVPLIANPLSDWLADQAVHIIAWIHNPTSQTTINRVMSAAQLAVVVLNLIGQTSLANDISNFLQTYGNNLSHQGLIDFSDTVRSHLGTNLTLMPLGMLIEMETDPQVVAMYKRVLDRNWSYLDEDHNAVVNLLHAKHGVTVGQNDLPHTLDQLQRHPVDMTPKEFDHSGDPGLVMSPWPDRFGRTGRICLQPRYFPIDQRGPDIFPWRGHPRQVKTGHDDPNGRVAPLGYLLPYWMARDMGFIGPAD